MKKLVYLIMLGGCLTVLLGTTWGVKRKDGTEPGYTGSPGDSLKNCTACHGGIATPVEGWITSNIPASGYVPGQQYTITATNTEFGGTRFGFEVSPQDIKGNLLGTIVLTDTNRTKLVGDKKYITYTSNGVDGQDSNSWTFDWIAPQAGTGDVVFYGAFNSNFDGHKGDDHTYLSTLRVKEVGTASLPTLPAIVTNVSVYPNPARDYIDVSFTPTISSAITVDITDLNGKQVALVNPDKQTGSTIKRINIASLSAGNYLVRFRADGQSQTRKITVVK
ncbi:MAG: choice-of-anchor V domain-containing protein [Bacteroidota bacterium]